MELSRRSLLTTAGFALAGGTVLIGTQYLARAETARVMTPPEAMEAAIAGDILLVDVRRPDEWATTGVPQCAVGIDMRRDYFLEVVLAARAYSEQPVAVICARGVRSARVTRLFEEAGIASIVDVSEGMLESRAGPGWLQRGLPVTTP